MTAPRPDRPALAALLRRLVDAARRERASLDVGHPDRDFFLGVEAAAVEVLKPELGVSRGEAWLEQQSPAFRNGYLAEQAQLAAVLTLDELPLELRLPPLPRRQRT